MSAAHNGRDAELTGHDGRVAGPAALLRDDEGCLFHHRLPIRRGHLGDQDVAGVEHPLVGGDVLERSDRP